MSQVSTRRWCVCLVVLALAAVAGAAGAARLKLGHSTVVIPDSWADDPLDAEVRMLRRLNADYRLEVEALRATAQPGGTEHEGPGAARPSVPRDGDERAPMNVWDGFEGVRWGAVLGEVAGMREAGVKYIPGLGDDAELAHRAVYVRSDDDLRLGNARLSAITYFANSGRLSSVMIEARGRAHCIALREAVSGVYGPALSLPDSPDQWVWRSVSASGDPIMGVLEAHSAELVSFVLYHQPLAWPGLTE